MNNQVFSEQAIVKWRWHDLKDNQIGNIEKKKKILGREEIGYGYDISVNDLNILGQNESAKTNNTKGANHPINNDKKNDKE